MIPESTPGNLRNDRWWGIGFGSASASRHGDISTKKKGGREGGGGRVKGGPTGGWGLTIFSLKSGFFSLSPNSFLFLTNDFLSESDPTVLK